MVQLAQALPSGDPLAAAIAAGETPSPEMVAASGSKEGLRPAIAWGLLAFIIVGLVGLLTIKDRVTLVNRIPFEKPPEALVERSHEIIRKAGFTDKYEDSAHGFMRTVDLSNSQTILFWYRQSPRTLGIFELATGETSRNNPPLQYPGEILVMLDTEGHLVSLCSVPPQKQSNNKAVLAMDWEVFFSEAGLDMSNWDEVDAQWNPLFYADTRTAWTGSLPNHHEKSVRIEAAVFQGKPVRFEIIGSWTQVFQEEPAQLQVRAIIRRIGQGLPFILAIWGGIFFARKNMRRGRGDRRGATRLAFFILVLPVSAWVLQLPQVSLTSLLLFPYVAVLAWIFYMAIEPYVRRQWPQILVSWTRFLSGKWWDPLVARDTLIGFAFGILIYIMFLAPSLLQFLGGSSGIGLISRGMSWRSSVLSSCLGARFVLSNLLTDLQIIVAVCLVSVCLLLIMKVILRNQKFAITAFILIWALFAFAQYGIFAAVLLPIFSIFILMRFGLVALIICSFSPYIFVFSPMTLQTSAWYAPYRYLALAIFATIVLFAFHTSLGGRPIFGTPRLDD